MAQGDTIKLLVIGDGEVGKTTLIARWLDNSFHPSFTVTIGVASSQKVLDRGKQKVKVIIWDAAGKEEFRTITPAYYKKAQGVLIVYGITNQKSFEQVKYWWEQVQEHGEPGTPVVVLGNKTDLVDDNLISLRIPQSEEDRLASELGVTFLCASAKRGKGVEEAFTALVDMICQDRISFIEAPVLNARKGFVGLLQKVQTAIRPKRAANRELADNSVRCDNCSSDSAPHHDSQAPPGTAERGLAESQEGKLEAEPLPVVAPSPAVMEPNTASTSNKKMKIIDESAALEISEVEIAAESPNEDQAVTAVGGELPVATSGYCLGLFWLCEDCKSAQD